MRISTLCLSFACLFMLQFPYAHAEGTQEKPEAAQETEKSNLNINVKVPPELGELNKKYKEIFETLTPEQQAQLEQLDKNNVTVQEPNFAIIINNQTFAACKSVDATIEETHGQMLESLVYSNKDKFYHLMAQFRQQLRAIDFIDREYVSGHLRLNDSMQMQMVTGMAGILAQSIKDAPQNTEKCDELKKELEAEYSTPYVAYRDYDSQFNYREIKEHGLKMCSLNWEYYTDAGEKVQTALLFSNPDDKTNLEASTTIYTKDGQRMDVEDTWIDFGSINTRLWAQKVQPYPELMILNMQKKNAPDILSFLMRKPAVIGAKSKQWDAPVIFKNNQIPSEKIGEMVKCMMMMDREMMKYFGAKDQAPASE